jgi:hypothetical protein
MLSVRSLYKEDLLTLRVVYFNVTSGGIGVVREHQLQKKPNPSLLSKEEQRKKKKNKSLDTEQIYGHWSQRGSMPRVTVLAGCQQ